MDDFARYPSIENSYQTKFIEGFVTQYPELLTADYILTEKIHGSNCQVCASPDEPVRFGKRTSFLEEGEKFYDIWAALERYAHIFNHIQWYADTMSETTILFGELYGPGVQKGVSYGDSKRLAFFDVMVNGELFSPVAFYNFMDLSTRSPDVVPRVAIVSGLQAALDFDVEFNSLLNPIEDNICEGVVIKPLDKVYYDSRGRRFCLKKKNNKFAEKVRAAKPIRPGDPVADRLNLEFRGYITTNRIDSIFSQHGEIEESSQIGEYIKLVMEDAKTDFVKDCGDDVGELDSPAQKKVFNVGSTIALMLKKYL